MKILNIFLVFSSFFFGTSLLCMENENYQLIEGKDNDNDLVFMKVSKEEEQDIKKFLQECKNNKEEKIKQKTKKDREKDFVQIANKIYKKTMHIVFEDCSKKRIDELTNHKLRNQDELTTFDTNPSNYGFFYNKINAQLIKKLNDPNFELNENTETKFVEKMVNEIKFSIDPQVIMARTETRLGLKMSPLFFPCCLFNSTCGIILCLGQKAFFCGCEDHFEDYEDNN